MILISPSYLHASTGSPWHGGLTTASQCTGSRWARASHRCRGMSFEAAAPGNPWVAWCFPLWGLLGLGAQFWFQKVPTTYLYIMMCIYIYIYIYMYIHRDKERERETRGKSKLFGGSQQRLRLQLIIFGRDLSGKNEKVIEIPIAIERTVKNYALKYRNEKWPSKWCGKPHT